MRIIKVVLIWILSMIGVIVLFIGFACLIGAVQEKLLLPRGYIMWIFKYPVSRWVFLYEMYLIGGVFYLLHKDFRSWATHSLKNMGKKNKRLITAAFIAFNIVCFYAIIFNVTVITDRRITDYTFFKPGGTEYLYGDVVKIDAGIYGKRYYLPFTHRKGDFYYIVQLKDGRKIDLTEMGGSQNNEDPRFILEKLDAAWVDMGVSKTSSMENFQYCTENLSKIYTDKIRKILLNDGSG